MNSYKRCTILESIRIKKCVSLHFNSPKCKPPQSFKLGEDEIHTVTSNKVKGVILDKDLNYEEHSKSVHINLLYKWISTCKYSNRNLGFNQKVLVRIIKAIFFSSLFYASMIWMKDKNIIEIEKLRHRISKSTTGAVFNISQIYAEIIIGIPPPHVTNLVNTIKHYLKLIYNQPDCWSYIGSELQKGDNSIVNSHIKETFKFLEWKAEKYPNSVSPNDVHIIQIREYAKFHYIMSQSCEYSKQRWLNIRNTCGSPMSWTKHHLKERPGFPVSGHSPYQYQWASPEMMRLSLWACFTVTIFWILFSMKNKEISVYHQCSLVEMESRQHSISLLTVRWFLAAQEMLL